MNMGSKVKVLLQSVCLSFKTFNLKFHKHPWLNENIDKSSMCCNFITIGSKTTNILLLTVRNHLQIVHG